MFCGAAAMLHRYLVAPATYCYLHANDLQCQATTNRTIVVDNMSKFLLPPKQDCYYLYDKDQYQHVETICVTALLPLDGKNQPKPSIFFLFYVLSLHLF